MIDDLPIYRLFIFDLDGTLVTTKSGEKFRKTADDWEWLPGRLPTLASLKARGCKIALATNQAGVAFSYSSFTEDEMQTVLEGNKRHIHADYLAVCYSSTSEIALPRYFNPNDERRKPGPGMLLEIMDALQVAKEDTLYVGDRPEDEQAAMNAGVSFVWAEAFFSNLAGLWDNRVPNLKERVQCPACNTELLLTPDGCCQSCGAYLPELALKFKQLQQPQE